MFTIKDYYVRRRKYLASSVGILSLLAGCSGSETDTNNTTVSETTSTEEAKTTSDETEAQSNCLEPVEIEKTGTGSIEKDGVRVEINEILTGMSYEGYSEEMALKGATFVGIPLSFEVVGDGKRRFPMKYSISLNYGLANLSPQRIAQQNVEFDGGSYFNTPDHSPLSFEKGEGKDGIFIYQVPEDFDPAMLVLEVYPTDRLRTDNEPTYWRLGESQNRYECPQLSPKPSKASRKDTIRCAGLETSIESIRTEQVIETDLGTEKEAGDGSFLVVKFGVDNISNIPRSLPELENASYDDDRHLRTAALAGSTISVAGESRTLLYQEREEDRPTTNGYYLFPGETATGTLVWRLPNGVDKKDVKITPEFEDGKSDPSWSLA